MNLTRFSVHSFTSSSTSLFASSLIHVISTLFAIYLIAGCATNISAKAEIADKSPVNSKNESNFTRQGRLSIRVASEPPQSLSGAFVLNGNAHNGDLSLSTPLGSVLAQLSWSPEQAVLKANNETHRFSTTDALLQELTGTSLPLAALFDWLEGRENEAVGWQADLSNVQNVDNPRLTAKRTAPLPPVELRIVLDK